jgi:hypothetical protein
MTGFQMWSIMRSLSVLLVLIFLGACSKTPVPRSESQSVSPTPTALQPQTASIDSIAEFLLSAAAADFRTDRASKPIRFREVHLGHMMVPSGEKQFMLCGQFQTAEAGRNVWIPFVTIQASEYEQYVGGEAAALCQNSSTIWDDVDDLSAALKTRLDSLR